MKIVEDNIKTAILILIVISLHCTMWGNLDQSVFSSSGTGVLFLKKTEIMTRNNWQSPPLDSNLAFRNLSKYDAIWCAQLVAKYNPAAWRVLRKNKPEQLSLYYLSGVSTDADGGFTYLDYKYINDNHPEWFLLADNRNVRVSDYSKSEMRIRWNYREPQHSYYNRFYLDIANKEFQEWAANSMLNFVSNDEKPFGCKYDGIAMDNVYIGSRLHNRLKYKYPHWKYANHYKAWVDGYVSYLKKVKNILNQHGYVLIVNHNPVGSDHRLEDANWNNLYESADGILSEQSLRSGWKKSSYFTGDEWLAAIERHELTLEKGLIDWWACHPEKKDWRGDDIFMYTYCSFLLVKEPEKSFYSLHAIDSVAQKTCWYDEYGIPLGAITSKRYLKNNCWVRDYENGKVIVNPTKRSQKVLLDTQILWLDWSSQKAVSEIEMRPRSGTIILPTSYSVN